jgi:PleD family two-component response regulator
MGGQEMNRIDLLIPLALADLFDPPPVETLASVESVPDANKPSDDAGFSPNTANSSGQPRSILLFEDNPADCQHVMELMANSGVDVVTAELFADTEGLFAREAIKAVVVGMTNTGDDEFFQCSKIYDQCRQQSLPIIMCSNKWTRTGVLRAVKCGANDILIKPYAGDELRSKLDKFINAR